MGTFTSRRYQDSYPLAMYEAGPLDANHRQMCLRAATVRRTDSNGLVKKHREGQGCRWENDAIT